MSWFASARARLRARIYGPVDGDRGDRPDVMVGALELRDGDLVVDLGSGGGYFTFRLARAVAPSGVVYAVDTDAGLLARIAARAAGDGVAVRTIRAEEGAPNLPEPVDLVFAAHSYHHLPDRVAYFRRLAGSLRPGGQVAITELRPIGFWRRMFGHATADEMVRSEMARAGYTLVVSHDIVPKASLQVFRPSADPGVPATPPPADPG